MLCKAEETFVCTSSNGINSKFSFLCILSLFLRPWVELERNTSPHCSMSEVCERIKVLLSWKPWVRHWPLERHTWTCAARVRHKSSHVAPQQHSRRTLHKHNRYIGQFVYQALLYALACEQTVVSHLSLWCDITLPACVFWARTLSKKTSTSSDICCLFAECACVYVCMCVFIYTHTHT